MSKIVRASVQGPKDLSIEEQEIVLRECAKDLIDLGIPFERITLTSDDLELTIDGTQ